LKRVKRKAGVEERCLAPVSREHCQYLTFNLFKINLAEVKFRKVVLEVEERLWKIHKVKNPA